MRTVHAAVSFLEIDDVLAEFRHGVLVIAVNHLFHKSDEHSIRSIAPNLVIPQFVAGAEILDGPRGDAGVLKV